MSDTNSTFIKALMLALPDSVEALMSGVPGSSTIFHYTSQQGLLGILKENKLWLSSIRYLNDAAEFRYSVDLFREKLTRMLRKERGPWNHYYGTILEKLDSVNAAAPFVGSFSEDGDSLSQWRAYTPNGVGFSIGLKYKDLNDLARKQQCRIVKCVYQESQHDAIAEEIIHSGGRLVNGGKSREAATMFVLGLHSIAPALKSPSFAEEREWRVVKQVIIPQDVVRMFRQGKSMLIPYTEFNLANADGRISSLEVFVGPTPHMELSVSSLHDLLRSAKVQDFQISPSSVPYRSW